MGEKYYTRSNGEKVKISDLETTHLSNALAKAYRDSFESKDRDDLTTHLQKINDLKEEMHKRINMFNSRFDEIKMNDK